MKLSMPSIGKSKKQGSGAFEDPVLVSSKPGVDSKAAKAGKDESSTGKQGFVSKIISRASLKSKKTKYGRIENGASAAPPSLQVSKSEKELRAAFRVYDADKDGRISHEELSKVLTSLGGEISEQEVQGLMKQIDKDDDGFISVEEFIAFHQTGTGPVSAGGVVSPVHDPMRDAFQMFDQDGDSRISASELQSVFISLGDKSHSLEDCKQMISSVDKDGDGHVDFMEFQLLMGSGQE